MSSVYFGFKYRRVGIYVKYNINEYKLFPAKEIVLKMCILNRYILFGRGICGKY